MLDCIEQWQVFLFWCTSKTKETTESIPWATNNCVAEHMQGCHFELFCLYVTPCKFFENVLTHSELREQICQTVWKQNFIKEANILLTNRCYRPNKVSAQSNQTAVRRMITGFGGTLRHQKEETFPRLTDRFFTAVCSRNKSLSLSCRLYWGLKTASICRGKLTEWFCLLLKWYNFVSRLRWSEHFSSG